MFEKAKNFFHDKSLQLGASAAIAAGTLLPSAFAADEGTSAIVTAIESASASIKSDAAPVIAAALGVGVMFWGAKILWVKYKGMAH